MKEQIRERFEKNLGRVQALLDLYRAGAEGAGRAAVERTDILRAAVVFLHATLEDVMRSALEWKLPEADPEHLADVTLLGCEKRSKFTLADLAQHRDKSVAEVLAESVTATLEDSNFNHPGDLERALEKIQVDGTAVLNPVRADLAAMMTRRHWIVHRVDRNDRPGTGQHFARSLSTTTVETWKAAVEGFATALLGVL